MSNKTIYDQLRAVGMTAEGFNYDLVKLFVAAYFQKIQKSQHNVFSAPKVPTVKFIFY